jgi:hypothetical protein
VHRFLVRARGKRRRRLENDIQFGLQGIGWDVIGTSAEIL